MINWYSYFFGFCTLAVINLIFGPYLWGRLQNRVNELNKRADKLDERISQVIVTPKLIEAYIHYKFEGETLNEFIERVVKLFYEGVIK